MARFDQLPKYMRELYQLTPLKVMPLSTDEDVHIEIVLANIQLEHKMELMTLQLGGYDLDYISAI